MSSEDAPVEGGVELATTLVPIDDDGGFLVLGELPDWIGVEPVPYVSHAQAATLADKLASNAGIGNALIQSWNAYNNATGLVRLAPETLAALKAGATPISQGGWSLGTLTQGGKFAHSVRWAPAGAAGAGSALATLGPALALMAVQWQLNKIGKAVERNLELTQTVLDSLREEAWYELDAAACVVLEAVQTAQAIGEVTDLDWAYLQSQSSRAVLLKHFRRNRDSLRRKLDELHTSKDPSSWFQQHYEDVMRHSQAIMTAQQGLSLHQLMRVAHAKRSDAEHSDALAEHILALAQREHDEAAREIDQSLRTLHRALSLWYEADPGARLTFVGVPDKRIAFPSNKGFPLGDVKKAVEDLHGRATAGPFRQLEPIKPRRLLHAQECVGIPEKDRPWIEQRLAWVLRDTESLVLLCKGEYSYGDSRERHLLAITDERAILVDHDALRRGREVAFELPTQGALDRTHKDGVETVELLHDGRSGVLRTKGLITASDVHGALVRLRARLACTDLQMQ